MKIPNLTKPPRFIDSAIGNYWIVSTDPLIFYIPQWIMIEPHRIYMGRKYDVLFDYLKDQAAVFLCNWNWRTESVEEAQAIRILQAKHAEIYPHHQFIHLCNTIRQKDVFEEYGLQAAFINQNCFIDENIFKPIDGSHKFYDAVYDAQIANYKRHDLATDIKNLSLIYYSIPIDQSAVAYTHEITTKLAGAHFFNHDESGEYRLLRHEEVNQCLNQCKVGLCLSQVEGAMYASMQYLLAGLPIVSTRSEGGRDVFFDDEYVVIVDDHPEAVSKGIENLVKRNIDPYLIRNRTLEKIREHRARFISLVQELYDSVGAKKRFADEWEKVFIHTLSVELNHYRVIGYLQSLKNKKVDPIQAS
uniref:Glycosyl transferase family 1 domain-containing protein n=1 Tax=Cyanothece sp. (strain PCC 7425 / ATCC 29141) TaxID=395961 RepID=B8HRD6_CYAP4